MARSLIDELEIEARHADHMAEMAKVWMKRAQKAERDAKITIAALVEAAGGEIVLDVNHLQRAREIVLEKYEDLRRRCWVYRTSRKDRP